MKPVERYRWQGIGRKILLIVILVALGGGFLFGKRGLLKWYQLRRMSHIMEARNDSLRAEIQEISGHIQALEEGDSLELERLARGWGLAREGEEIFIIREEGDTVRTLPQ